MGDMPSRRTDELKKKIKEQNKSLKIQMILLNIINILFNYFKSHTLTPLVKFPPLKKQKNFFLMSLQREL